MLVKVQVQSSGSCHKGARGFSLMHDTLRLKYPGRSCDPSIKYDALAARQSSPALHGSPYGCIEPHGQRIATMIRKSQFRSTCVPFEWK